MESKVEVWRLVEPGTPTVSVRRSYTAKKWRRNLDIYKVQEEIAAVGARVNSITEHIDNIKAALPELDNKIGYASLGMPTSSLPLDQLQSLKAIHFKLLQFWEDLSRKQLEKLAYLSDCLQMLMEQKEGKSTLAADGVVTYKEIGQHVVSEMQVDVRKELELDLLSYVPKLSKPTTKFHSPPKRGPQQIGKEQEGKEGVAAPSTSRLQLISTPSLELHRISSSSTPAHRCTPTAPPAPQQI